MGVHSRICSHPVQSCLCNPRPSRIVLGRPICKRSEGAATDDAIGALFDQFDLDCRSRGLTWLSLTEAVLQRVESVYHGAPENLYLRAADALHLATAADFGYEQIYSNDRLLLSAATYFGLQGVNLLGAE